MSHAIFRISRLLQLSKPNVALCRYLSSVKPPKSYSVKEVEIPTRDTYIAGIKLNMHVCTYKSLNLSHLH